MRSVLEIRVYQNKALLEIDRIQLPKPKELVWVSGMHAFGRSGHRYHYGVCRVVDSGSFGEFQQIERADAIAQGYTACHLPECG